MLPYSCTPLRLHTRPRLRPAVRPRTGRDAPPPPPPPHVEHTRPRSGRRDAAGNRRKACPRVVPRWQQPAMLGAVGRPCGQYRCVHLMRVVYL
eukprot:5640982-Prymnesium_polylepis.1